MKGKIYEQVYHHHYKHGQLHGIQLTPTSFSSYTNGKLMKKIEELGYIKIITQYKGIYKKETRIVDGITRHISRYKNNYLHGKTYYYKPDGTLLKIITYNTNKVIRIYIPCTHLCT